MKYYVKYNSLIGELYLIEEDGYLVEINFYVPPDKSLEKNTMILALCKKELEEYFKNVRKEFNIPIRPEGTEFQKKVWNALTKIPYGESGSYKDVAIMIGNSKGCRAIGMASNKNPIPIIIPCHRVIGSNNRLVGYKGGIDKKIFLLNLEKINYIE